MTREAGEVDCNIRRAHLLRQRLDDQKGPHCIDHVGMFLEVKLQAQVPVADGKLDIQGRYLINPVCTTQDLRHEPAGTELGGRLCAQSDRQLAI